MSSVVGLEMPNAWRTGQVNDPTFDISADQLNVTANREMWVPSSTIDWATVRHTNATDPVGLQDLATKNYVDINGGNQWSTFPAVQDVDMATFEINNLADPVLAQDAATKNYVDTEISLIDLNTLTDVTVTTPILNDILQFNGSLWVNQPLSVPAGSVISQGDSSVAVIDAGLGVVNTTIDNVIRSFINASLYSISVPITMNSQQINSLGTPAVGTDAATKAYVDTEISNLVIPSELDDLTDVTITTPLINQILVNNGAGQWVNQILGRAQLPSEIAYEDEINTFSLNQNLAGGATVGDNVELGMLGGFITSTKYQVYDLQASEPPTPALNDTTLFMDPGTDFNSSDPILAVLIDRGGTIEKKPIASSETIFALNQFTNGMFPEETGVKIITDGGIGIRVQQFNENVPSGTFTVVLDGQIFTITDPDVSPSVGNTIDLSVGTDIAPTKHWVWTENILGVPTMQSSTVSFPSTGDFAVVGTFLLQSQASVLADGAYAVNSPDYEIFDESSRGHLAHINDRLVELDSSYISGIDLTTVPAVGGGTLTSVTYTSTSGRSFELHTEDIEAFDISTGIALVENDGNQATTEVTRVVNLSADLIGMLCGDGVDLMFSANNDTANVVVYTIHQDAEPNTTNYGINIPFQQYTNDDAAAIADSSNFAIKTVPLNVRGITLLIAEIVIKFTTGGNYEVLFVRDLRGQIPGAAGGGSGGGGGASELNDLSDVTINSPALDESLIFNGAGQWVNKLTPQLETANIWTNYQDYTAIADPGASLAGVIRFFVETIDANNDALFCHLNQDGIIQKVRIA